MQYLRQTVVALSVLLAGVGCSENPTQKELTDETIRLNKTLIDEGAINPKTQYLKHGEDVKVVPAVQAVEIDKPVAYVNYDAKLEKIIVDRDAAIRANVELKKINSALKSQTSTLSENQSSSKGKIAAGAAALLAAQQLTADRDGQIAKLIAERDEAIKVTLGMKKANTDVEVQTSDLNTQIQALMQTQSEYKSASSEKIAASVLAVEDAQKLTADRDDQIAKLISERDEAIKVTLEMKKSSADVEVQTSDLNTQIQALMQTQSEYKSASSEKIAASVSAVEDAQKLTADRDDQIAKLIAERDDAIKITLEMKNANADLEAKASLAGTQADEKMQALQLSGDKSVTLLEDRKRELDKLTNDLSHMNDNIARETEAKQKAIDELSEFKTKLTASATELSNAQSLTSDKDGKIDSLGHERDEAIKVTLEMKKANEELNEKLNNLAQVQSESTSVSKEKISNLASLLTEAEQLNVDRDANIEKLTKEKDAAIQVTMGMKKDYETQKLALNEKIAKLIAERDEAIKVTLEMQKASKDFEDQKANLGTKIQSLMQTQSENESSSKGKIATAAAALLAAQQLTADKDSNIEKLIKERDEAIRVTLEMKKASADFEAQKSELDGKIETLTQTQSKNESDSKEKLTKLAALLEEADKSTNDKDTTIANLTKEKDAAIQVAMGMKKDCADFEKSMQESAKNESLSKEKIVKLAALLSEVEESTVDKDSDIDRLTKERDAAIQVSMGMQKKLEDGKKASNENAKKLVLDNIVSTFKLSKVEFKTGSAILTDKSTGLLDRVAGIMSEHAGYNYKIQGHTDSQGKQASNVKLSQARADSVKSYLVSKGISDAVLSTEGFGASAPIADNATKAGRLQNRRVVFEIVD